MEVYLTVEQVSARLQVHPATVIRWIKANRLNAVRLGSRQYRISEREMERFLTPAIGVDQP